MTTIVWNWGTVVLQQIQSSSKDPRQECNKHEQWAFYRCVWAIYCSAVLLQWRMSFQRASFVWRWLPCRVVRDTVQRHHITQCIESTSPSQFSSPLLRKLHKQRPISLCNIIIVYFASCHRIICTQGCKPFPSAYWAKEGSHPEKPACHRVT